MKGALRVALLFLVLPVAAAQGADTFEPEQREWIQEHGPLVVGVQGLAPPAAFVEDNVTVGWAIDLLSLATLKAGFDVRFVPFDVVDDQITALRDGTVDLVAPVGERPDITAFAAHSAPLAKPPIMFATTAAHPEFRTVADIQGRVSTIPGSPMESRLMDEFPDLEYVPTGSTVEGVDALVAGDLDAYLGPLAAIGYEARHHLEADIRPVGEPLGELTLYAWARADDAMPLAVLDAALEEVSPEESGVIHVKWTGFDLSAQGSTVGVPSWLAPLGYTLGFALLVATLGVVVGFQRLQVRRAQAELAVQKEREQRAKVVMELETTRRMQEYAMALINRSAHEFATPLMPMTTILSALRTRIDDEEALHNVDLLERNLARLSKVHHKVVHAAQLDAAGMEGAPRHRVDLAKTLSAIAARHGDAAKNKGMIIEADTLEAWVMGSEDRLRFALDSLVENAIQHSGGTHIHVRCRDVPGRWRIEVQDDGVGIGPAIQAALCEPYHHDDVPGPTGERGPGLGLYIARSAVEVDGGTIRCESEAGQGSTFSIDLPKADLE